MRPISNVEVVIPNLKRRLSGITATLERVLPVQARQVAISTFGAGISSVGSRIQLWDLPRLWWRPTGKPFRIWHARRNNEMLAGVLLRDILRMPL